MKKNEQFELHRYPYIYQCPDCKSRFTPEPKMELSKADECALKKEYRVKSDLPLFFVCDFCFNNIMKPIGYTGEPSKVIGGEISDLEIGLFGLFAP